jgi:hypothetical protein
MKKIYSLEVNEAGEKGKKYKASWTFFKRLMKTSSFNKGFVYINFLVQLVALYIIHFSFVNNGTSA